GADAVLVRGLPERGHHFGMAGQAEVVVAGKVEETPAAREDVLPLLPREHAQAPAESFPGTGLCRGQKAGDGIRPCHGPPLPPMAPRMPPTGTAPGASWRPGSRPAAWPEGGVPGADTSARHPGRARGRRA